MASNQTLFLLDGDCNCAVYRLLLFDNSRRLRPSLHVRRCDHRGTVDVFNGDHSGFVVRIKVSR